MSHAYEPTGEELLSILRDLGLADGTALVMTHRMKRMGWGLVRAHGTRGIYMHRRCRCALCRAANAAYLREWRRRRAA